MESRRSDCTTLIEPITPVSRVYAWVARARTRLFLPIPILLFVTASPDRSYLVLGTVGALLGSLLRLWGAGYLDKNARLTTEGPYRFMRHPLYLGSLFIVGGWGLMNGQAGWAIGCFVYAFLLFWCAMWWEEYQLIHLFPEYGDYRASVPMLIPLKRSGRVGEGGCGGMEVWEYGRVRANGEWKAIFWSWLVVLLFWGRYFYEG